MTGTASNSDDVVYTARLEVRVRDLEQLVAQHGDELIQLLGVVRELAESSGGTGTLAQVIDRHEQLAARVRILEQSAGG